MSELSNISDWKQFERLCADLLEAEGFRLEAEPSVDTTGIDIVASCEYKAHAANLPPVRVRWLVQCKHLAQSGRRLGRREVEEILASYDAARRAHDGLLIITSSDLTEPSTNVLSAFADNKPDTRIMVWNQRQLAALLDRHSNLIRRYGLSNSEPALALLPPPQLATARSRSVLFLSDQSALAHDLSAYIKSSGLRVVFLPFWNYSDGERLSSFLESHSASDFDLGVLFLGDSFGMPFPATLEKMLVRICENRGSLLLFPFVAWSIAQGALTRLGKFVPVNLATRARYGSLSARTRALVEEHREIGRWVASQISFEEDEYREYDPRELRGLTRMVTWDRIGISHSFEHLDGLGGCDVVWRDTLGNPFLVRGCFNGARVAYLNTSCHSCINTYSPTAIPSPMAISNGFRNVMGSLLQWLLERPVNCGRAR